MMKKTNTASVLFRTAALHSERLRIQGILAALLFFITFTYVRTALHEASLKPLFWKTLLLLLGAVIYEVVLLVLIWWANRQQRTLPGWLTFLTIIIETSIPTLGLFIMVTQSGLDPYSVLLAPIVSIYFLFLILSTLRLQQFLCILAGLTASAGYFAVMCFVYLRWPDLLSEDKRLALSAHITYGVLILLGGLLAALVARKIRTEISGGILQIEKSQRVEADLEVARSIQTGLLPQSKPQLKEYDVAGHTWPADQTGGDYFDWFPLPDGRWAFAIADVMGHGIGPALVTANCHAYVRAIFGTNGDLSDWISRINHFLDNDLEVGRFVTFLAAVLDHNKNSVAILSAGHGPTLRYQSSTASIEELPTQGPPLGILADSKYDSPITFSLNQGDFLVLLTDGFMEWANPQTEEFGITRLKNFLSEHSNLTSTQIINRLRDEVISFASGTSQKDDLTAVIIKRL